MATYDWFLCSKTLIKVLIRCWQAQLLKALKDMSDIDDNDLDVTPVRDNGLSGTPLVYAVTCSS